MKSIEYQCEVYPYLVPSGKLLKRHIVDNSRFVIDNKSVVRIVTFEDLVRVTFELCFSNYESNLEYIFNVPKKISLLGRCSDRTMGTANSFIRK